MMVLNTRATIVSIVFCWLYKGLHPASSPLSPRLWGASGEQDVGRQVSDTVLLHGMCGEVEGGCFLYTGSLYTLTLVGKETAELNR